MVRKLLLSLVLVLSLPALARADNDLIQPDAYLCAELISEPGIMKGEPPLFQALQVDGWVSAEIGQNIASPDTVQVVLTQTYMWCQKNPDVKVMQPWKEMRSTGPKVEGRWNAETSTCRDYALDPDDASGFIIWLDAWNRKTQNTAKSILKSDSDIQEFIDACMISPQKKMIDVLREHSK